VTARGAMVADMIGWGWRAADSDACMSVLRTSCAIVTIESFAGQVRVDIVTDSGTHGCITYAAGAYDPGGFRDWLEEFTI